MGCCTSEKKLIRLSMFNKSGKILEINTVLHELRTVAIKHTHEVHAGFKAVSLIPQADIGYQGKMQNNQTDQQGLSFHRVQNNSQGNFEFLQEEEIKKLKIYVNEIGSKACFMLQAQHIKYRIEHDQYPVIKQQFVVQWVSFKELKSLQKKARKAKKQRNAEEKVQQQKLVKERVQKQKEAENIKIQKEAVGQKLRTE